MLKVDHVSKEYPSPSGSLKIVSDVSLSLARGDAVSIMGPSWEAARARCSISWAHSNHPPADTISLDGQNPFQLREKELAGFRNKEIGFIFQDHCLLPQCSVLENVLTPTLVSTTDDGK